MILEKGLQTSINCQFITKLNFCLFTLQNQPRNKILGGAGSVPDTDPAANSNTSAVPPATRPSITNDSNILLDPDVLDDQVTQVLVLTVMATLVKYTTHESEVRILYEYLAEASVVFPKVFPVIHSLLDAKITNVLVSQFFSSKFLR